SRHRAVHAAVKGTIGSSTDASDAAALDPGAVTIPTQLRPWNAVPLTADEPELLRATQMLTSEQAMLQSARAANVAEATGRTLLFVSITSAAIFGLGLIAQMARLGPQSIAFSLVLLPGLCVLGVETFMRVLVLLVEDATYARAMDHIRRYYVDHAPS